MGLVGFGVLVTGTAALGRRGSCRRKKVVGEGGQLFRFVPAHST